MNLQKKFPEFFERTSIDQEVYVPSTGNESADKIIIGEAPGENEVKQEEPFVGRAGKRLNKILHEIGVDRSELYITNVVKERPPNNKTPNKDEIEKWRPLLEKEIETVDPEYLIPVGNVASQIILDTNKGITQIHGSIENINGWKVMPTFHPAATLYDPDKRPGMKRDLKKIFKDAQGQQTLTDLG